MVLYRTSFSMCTYSSLVIFLRVPVSFAATACVVVNYHLRWLLPSCVAGSGCKSSAWASVRHEGVFGRDRYKYYPPNRGGLIKSYLLPEMPTKIMLHFQSSSTTEPFTRVFPVRMRKSSSRIMLCPCRILD